MKRPRNRLPRETVRALDDAVRSLRFVMSNGLADDYSIFPPQALTAGQRRDAETIIRAVERLFAAEPAR